MLCFEWDRRLISQTAMVVISNGSGISVVGELKRVIRLADELLMIEGVV